jgi:hypothetical protein
MKINTKALEAEWFEFSDDSQIQIRPIPNYLKMIHVDNKLSWRDDGWEAFDYAVVSWKGFNNEDGSDFVCDKKNKRIMFDHIDSVVAFVYEKLFEKGQKLTGEIKNLKTSPGGKVKE